MKNEVFTYNGSAITFASGNGNVMVNATEMAKPFGKLTADWLRLKATNDFISAFSTVKGIPISAMVQVIKGGNSSQGTFLYEDVALEFSRWLSPEFSIWCNDRIKELLKYGMTATPQALEDMINNPDLVIQLATQLKKERAEKEALRHENAKLQVRSDFVDKVFATNDLITMSQCAKLLKLPYGRNIMLKKLRQGGVLFKNSNEPYQHLVDKGYFVIKEREIPRDNHPPKIIMQTFPTQKGLAFIAKTLGVVIPVPNSKMQLTT